MAIAWSDVSAVAPALSTTALSTQTEILAVVVAQMNASSWGDLYDTGATYLAAHLGTLAARSASGGTGVASETVGPLSRAYTTPQGVYGSLGLTGFGAEYLRLLRLLPTSLGVVA